MSESYPSTKKTDINDANFLEQSPQNFLFQYDFDTIPFYDNQKGCIRDYAERESFWDIERAIQFFICQTAPKQKSYITR